MSFSPTELRSASVSIWDVDPQAAAEAQAALAQLGTVDTQTVELALTTLKGKARVKRTMWSRRAQEYEAKINSGDLISIAEVVRDLFRSDRQPEQSYSERQLYEIALDRMAREVAAVDKTDETAAVERLESTLQSATSARLDKTESETAAAAALPA